MRKIKECVMKWRRRMKRGAWRTAALRRVRTVLLDVSTHEGVHQRESESQRVIQTDSPFLDDCVVLLLLRHQGHSIVHKRQTQECGSQGTVTGQVKTHNINSLWKCGKIYSINLYIIDIPVYKNRTLWLCVGDYDVLIYVEHWLLC